MVTSIIATFFALIFLTTIAININKMAKYKIQYSKKTFKNKIKKKSLNCILQILLVTFWLERK